ncbi:hypothetical protein PROVALCAL_00477 [Providencia alcalifaciens DSM 30120]|uniref:Uncharacterized protein n=1 Tax=Providencia alcalifaciens DSM 30120 TaxID=520999 RepID=B6XAX5_9GAMM|nr:hypothetical protein PROVALCAL_00477 [Providencia alcalifaciens DSM 30120]
MHSLSGNDFNLFNTSLLKGMALIISVVKHGVTFLFFSSINTMLIFLMKLSFILTFKKYLPGVTLLPADKYDKSWIESTSEPKNNGLK